MTENDHPVSLTPDSTATTTSHQDELMQVTACSALNGPQQSCENSKAAETGQRQERIEANGEPTKHTINWHLDGGQAEGGNKETIDEHKLTFLGAGKSGVVHGIDSGKVWKVFHDEEAGQVERRVYQRLGSHPNFTKLLGTTNDGSLILERGESLRTIIQTSSNNIPIQTKICWLLDAAAGLQHMHSQDIIHADVGCSNLILTGDGCVKLIDFEGCSVDGGIAGSCYEWFSYCPSTPRVTRGTDVFAFGCAIYELSAGRPPFHELEKSADPYREVEQLYTNKCFPNVAELPLGQLIRKCWDGDISTMEGVIRELDMYHSELSHREKLQ